MPDRITDAAIEDAIRRSIEPILREFDPRTHRLKGLGAKPDALACGLNALSVYALMQAGMAIDDPRISSRSEFMKDLVDGMKALPADQGFMQTYARGIRATALATYNRPGDRLALTEDVGCLFHGHVNGAYSYSTARMVGTNSFKFDAPGWTDHSNSQYGLLGVWAGAEAGLDIPPSYWEKVVDHWTHSQQADGTWTYLVTGGDVKVTKGQRAPTGHGGVTNTPLAMTAAGLASTLVARDYLLANRRDTAVGEDPYPRPIGPALRWWELGDNSVRIPSLHWGYVLFGVERVGLASGLKYFGKIDWYRTLVAQTLQNQRPGGGWTRPDAASPDDGSAPAPEAEQVMGDRPNTAFALLFLSRGRHPVLMNKLRFEDGAGHDGAWANRPRDLAGLSRFVGRQLERQLNWQVVDLKHDWHDWLDAPILLIASHDVVRFTDADYTKFRAFVNAGGLIVTQADGDAPAFTRFVEEEFGKKVLPQYAYADLPQDHPIYFSLFPMVNRPKLRAISNGSRVMLLHSPQDLSISWQLRDEKFHRNHFELGANLFIYAAGRRDLRNRLDSPFVPEPTDGPATGQTLRVARLTYEGDCDPEPWAWTRFARLFQFRTGSAVRVIRTKWQDLKPDTAPVVHLTGAAKYRASDAEVAALKAYVEAGGLLLIDDCGGSGAFYGSTREALARAFPDAKLQRLPAAHPLLHSGAPGMEDLSTPKPRPYAAELFSKENATLETVTAGKGRVLLSRLDITSGFLGTNTLPVIGYQPQYAQSLMQNLLFWVADGRPGDGSVDLKSEDNGGPPATAPGTQNP